MVVEYGAPLVASLEELMTRLWLVLGGVSKLPTLAMVVGVCEVCGVVTLLEKGYLCIGGGGSSKLPSCWA